MLLRFWKILVLLTMGALFFAVAAPTGIGMRAIGWDPLRLRFDPGRPSYWLRRSPKRGQTSMAKQY
ncbi:MAG: hypothetical protein ACREE9_22290 [Stellaceae bacterium]